LRIGLAAARGIGLAAGRPVVGVTTFAAVAEGLAPAERAGRHLLVVIDSKRAELYAQRFDPGLAEAGGPVILTPDALAALPLPEPLLVAGDGASLLRPHLCALARDIAFSERSGPPDARDVARLAARPGARLLPPRPLYLHPPEVTLPATPA
jgi:tRNA threonylcarbamoyladenosine biosynthesis protein TsaB